MYEQVITAWKKQAHAAQRREQIIPQLTLPYRCCRTCEYADGGGEIAKKTAATVDCLNPNSDQFTPEWDHVCQAWMAESEVSDD